MSIINVTDSAAERIRDLLDRDGKLDSHGLRIRVVGGGCSGLKYELVFDDEFREVDDEIHAGEIRVIIDEKSALYVMGSTLNFVDSLQESGFKLENPNASATCGCGESFAA
jgi:iron-sulfur cluster assembly accessory protein